MSLAERLAKTDRPDRLADVRNRVQAKLVEGLGPKLYDSSRSDRELQDLVHRRLRDLSGRLHGGISRHADHSGQHLCQSIHNRHV